MTPPPARQDGYVVGTAGHIDHGKSTLIRALTGIDPDRLEEEKRRGMTIDLGFAHLTLPSGRLVGIVDVPGHARFIRNMLAGVHGLDAVLLVVAADEGVMPQTVEHLEIVDLLEVGRGLVAITKVDLVEDDWLELVTAEVTDALARTCLRGATLVPVSAVTGQGLERLVQQLDELLAATPPRADRGRPRLPVDRVFTISGFGTVVTGTLVDGSLRVGEEVELQPSGRRARIRGLQQHNRRVEVALPGSRVAANLVGVEKEDLGRGEVLARPGTLVVTRRVDARVRVLAGGPGLRHGAQVLVHAGTAEVSGRAVVLGGEEIEPGEAGWIQLYLNRPIAATSGDRYVLRLPSPSATIAGGVFADVTPRRHHRHDQRVRESLERRAAGEILQEELRKYPRGITAPALLKASLAEDADLARLDARRAGQWLFAPEAWEALAGRARRALEDYHRAHRLRPGMPREELKSRLGLPSPVFAAVLAELAREGTVVDREGEVALPEHRVEIDAGAATRLVEVLGARPFAPPSLPEALRVSGATEEVVRALVRRGDLVRLSEDVVFTRSAYEAAVALVRELVAEQGSVTVASLRDRMGASRRPVLALLEHLDAQRVTRRIGDARVLR
ncbi:MAG TPA: selenocysteine-specific translation elongation factor [Candidatus Dormibacteraeota bacterium]|nr:selenocysteine-specific translation elongation factor [Candidatus Dormibacteraeota bacterium]